MMHFQRQNQSEIWGNSSDNVTTVSLIYILKIDISPAANRRCVNRNQRSKAFWSVNPIRLNRKPRACGNVFDSLYHISGQTRSAANRSRVGAQWGFVADQHRRGAAVRLLPAGAAAVCLCGRLGGNSGALRWTDRQTASTYIYKAPPRTHNTTSRPPGR